MAGTCPESRPHGRTQAHDTSGEQGGRDRPRHDQQRGRRDERDRQRAPDTPGPDHEVADDPQLCVARTRFRGDHRRAQGLRPARPPPRAGHLGQTADGDTQPGAAGRTGAQPAGDLGPHPRGDEAPDRGRRREVRRVGEPVDRRPRHRHRAGLLRPAADRGHPGGRRGGRAERTRPAARADRGGELPLLAHRHPGRHVPRLRFGRRHLRRQCSALHGRHLRGARHQREQHARRR